MKVLSLFDGISCARLALQKSGIQVERYYASEIDKYAISITQRNWPETIQVGDITKLKYENGILKTEQAHWFHASGMLEIDLIIGGSPCQDLSISKSNREGLAGKRSSLFFDFVRLIKEIKPKYFVLENVASMPKTAKEVMSAQLWNIEPVMINASLVSAQNRKRLFWVGKLIGDEYKAVTIPLPEDRGIALKDILEEDVAEKYFLSEKVLSRLKLRNPSLIPNIDSTIKVGQIGGGGQGERVYSIEGKSSNLNANGGGLGAKTGLYFVGGISGRDRKKDGKDLSANYPEGNRVYSDEGKAASLTAASKGNAGGYTGLYLVGKEVKGVASRTFPRYKQEGVERHKQIEVRDDEKANSLTTIQTDSMVGIYDYYNDKIKEDGKAKTLGTNPQCLTSIASQLILGQSKIRKLTPMECERLQGVTDTYSAFGIKDEKEVVISDSQRYKVLGNAFNCDVVAHILSSLDIPKVEEEKITQGVLPFE
jgi:DNA (cytosine-5)-methyltransferase 3A